MRKLLSHKEFIKNFKTKTLIDLYAERPILEEYKPNNKQVAAFKKWASRKDLGEALELMDRFFDSYPKLKNKDINSYKSLEELRTAVEEAESWETHAEKKKKLKKQAIKKNFGNLTGVLTLSPEASQFYGGGTTWCTTMRDEIYHWLLHRIIGVEFYIINNALNEGDDLWKVSVHINWNKRYSTVYNADNKVTFDGVTHEYYDINDLKAFLGNDELFEWIMSEFELTQKDAPKFVNTLIKKLTSNGIIEKVFSKYHVLKYAIDYFLDTRKDELNETEYDFINDFTKGIGKTWLEDFKNWINSKNYEDVVDLLNQAEEKQRKMGEKIALDDHVVIMEFFYKFLEERPNLDDEFYSTPIIFDQDDIDWIDNVVSLSNNDELIDMFEDDEDELIDILDNYYETQDVTQNKGEKRIESHIRLFNQAIRY